MHLFVFNFATYGPFVDNTCEAGLLVLESDIDGENHSIGTSWFYILDVMARIPVSVRGVLPLLPEFETDIDGNRGVLRLEGLANDASIFPAWLDTCLPPVRPDSFPVERGSSVGTDSDVHSITSAACTVAAKIIAPDWDRISVCRRRISPQ